jgi:prenylcysteine oxidase/farnesylcysteine lyase
VSEDYKSYLTCVVPGEEDSQISWYYPHVWQAYPYNYPRSTFEEIEIGHGFYYTSGIESFISTMETSALMGKNVAKLLVDDFTGLRSEDTLNGREKLIFHEL